MAIDNRLWPIYREFFSTLHGKKDFLLSGYQEVEHPHPDEFNFLTVQDGLNAFGHNAISMDFQDGRADIDVNLNDPIRNKMHERFDVLFDIGTIEHVADTISVFRNYFQCLRVGGVLFLLTPVCGYYNHGFHTFSPEFIEGMISLNGFRITKTIFASPCGKILSSANEMTDVLIILIAEKTSRTPDLLCLPQQKRWTR